MKQASNTFRLFKEMPSFINGLAANIDIFSDEELKYNVDATEKDADWNAIYADWKSVGADLKLSIEQYAVDRK